jgi:hypothetical protein
VAEGESLDVCRIIAEPIREGPLWTQTAVTLFAELSSSLFFRCESCGFIWLEDKPQVPDAPGNRPDN